MYFFCKHPRRWVIGRWSFCGRSHLWSFRTGVPRRVCRSTPFNDVFVTPRVPTLRYVRSLLFTWSFLCDVGWFTFTCHGVDFVIVSMGAPSPQWGLGPQTWVNGKNPSFQRKVYAYVILFSLKCPKTVVLDRDIILQKVSVNCVSITKDSFVKRNCGPSTRFTTETKSLKYNQVVISFRVY